MLKALKFYSFFLAPLLVALVFSAYVSFLERADCAFLLEMNVSVLSLLAFCFLLPGTLFVSTLYLLYFSIKAKGQDCYPPADIPWRRLFTQRQGWQAKLAKAAGYLAPLFGLWLIWLGTSSFNQIADGRSLAELNVSSAAACEGRV